jgi:hypothetical protein
MSSQQPQQPGEQQQPSNLTWVEQPMLPPAMTFVRHSENSAASTDPVIVVDVVTANLVGKS